MRAVGHMFGAPVDRQRASARHCIARVERHVQQGAFELRFIDERRRVVGGTVDDKRHVVGEDAANRGLQAAEQCRDRRRPRLRDLLAAQRQQPARESGGAARRLKDLVQTLLSLTGREALVLRHLGPADDDCERVVEIVGDTAGHAGEGFDSSGSLERLLGLLPLLALVHALTLGSLERETLLAFVGGETAVDLDLVGKAFDNVQLRRGHHHTQQRHDDDLPDPDPAAQGVEELA